MNLLKDILPLEGCLELQVHELAWLMLKQMQLKGKQEHAANWFNEIANSYDPPTHGAQISSSKKKQFLQAVAESYSWLITNGLVATVYESNYLYHFVTRKGNSIRTEDEFALFIRESPLKPDALHPVIRKEAWPLYARGKFDLAILEAFKRVEIGVHTAGGYAVTDLGTALMRKAFDKKTGALTDYSLPEAEREALAHLFSGAIGAFKNPSSHREIALDDPNRAAELLMLASHLLRVTKESSARGQVAQSTN